MGVHISAYFKNGKEWPDWNSGRMGGDREFAACDLDAEKFPLASDMGHVIEWGYRPKDFTAWRARFTGEEAVNSDRFEQLLAFLEANPGSYFYAGY